MTRGLFPAGMHAVLNGAVQESDFTDLQHVDTKLESRAYVNKCVIGTGLKHFYRYTVQNIQGVAMQLLWVF